MPLGPESIRETAFEKKRGIARIEVRTGLAQIRVSGLAEPAMAARLAVLDAIAEAGVSIDFLKLVPAGLSFIVQDGDLGRAEQALRSLDVTFDALGERDIVLVHAANMRDEEGRIAHILRHAIRCGVGIEHVTDMHDRMLIVVGTSESDCLREALAELEAES